MRFKRIYVEIGNMCNLHCLFCSNDDRSNKQMCLKEFSEVISKIKGYTDYIYLHVKGEPLMHPLLGEFLELCNKEKMNVNITTNATLLAKNKDILFKNACVRQVNISVHALPYIDKFDQIKYLDDICNFILENKKLLKLYISIRLWTDSNEANNYILDYFSKRFNQQFDYSSNKITDKAFFSFDSEFEWPSLNNEFVSEVGRCLGTFTHIAILASGDVVPCCLDSSGSEVLGNIFESSFDDILLGDKFKEINEGFSKGKVTSPLCQRCSYRLRFNK